MKEKTRFSLIFLFLIYIYPIYIKNMGVLTQIILYIVPLMFFVLNYKFVLQLYYKIKPNIFFSTISISVLVLFSIIIPIIHNTNDFSYVGTSTFIIRRIIIYLFLLTIIYKNFHKENVLDKFMKYFIISTSIYILFTALMVAIGPLKNLVISIIDSGQEYEKLSKSFGYTMRVGWQGFSGFRHTFRSTLSIAFAMHLFYTSQKKEKLMYWLLVIICLLGNMFYGRIGIVVSTLIILMSVLINKKISFFDLFKIGLAVLAVFLVILLIAQFSQPINEWVYWFTTPFKNLFTTGSMNNHSVSNIFENMIYFPELKTLLIGEGFFTDPISGGYYKTTDVGYMRQILFWGAGLTLLSYVTLFSTFLGLKRRYYLIILSFIIIFIFFEFKGDIYQELIPISYVFVLMDNIISNKPNKKLIELRVLSAERNSYERK